MDYKNAGVDIDAGEQVARIAARVSAKTPGRDTIVSGIGGFAALVSPEPDSASLLVFSTDGVGTKLLLARQYGMMQDLGIDLVAMCANDVLCTGARGIAFLDYYATGALDLDEADVLLQGIAEGCRRADVPLVGGETAELPGLYTGRDFDLAGFMAGIVQRDAVLGPDLVKPGDVLIGIRSTGPHSNGYSLIRKVIERRSLDLGHVYEGLDRPLGEALLAPTAIYSRPVWQLHREHPGMVHAAAHITGGGLAGNLQRVLPRDVHAMVDRSAIPENPLWDLLQGNDITDAEMRRVFNMGVGMVLIVAAGLADKARELLQGLMAEQEFLHGLDVFVMGEVRSGAGPVRESG